MMHLPLLVLLLVPLLVGSIAHTLPPELGVFLKRNKLGTAARQLD
jgi:hypothetical protein